MVNWRCLLKRYSYPSSVNSLSGKMIFYFKWVRGCRECIGTNISVLVCRHQKLTETPRSWSVTSDSSVLLTYSDHMRRFPEPQHFLLQHDKIGIYDPPKRVLDKLYSDTFFHVFQNIGLVEPGFEASRSLHKCEPPLWSIVNCQKCRKLTIYGWTLRASTFT